MVSGLVDARAAAFVTFSDDGAPGKVLASFGYDGGVLEVVSNPSYHREERSYREILDDPERSFRCWWNVDFDFARTDLAQRHLLPAGFGGGMTARLMGQDGEHAGDLHLSTEARAYPTPDATDTLMSARNILAKVCARSATPSAKPNGVTHTMSVTPDLLSASVLNSVDPATDRLYTELSLRVAKAAKERGVVLKTAMRWRDPQGDWQLLETSPADDNILVTVTPMEVPHQISPRELDVLSLLVEGLTNYSISLRLQLSERTVAHTVARIFTKLDVTSRAAAAAAGERYALKLLPGVGSIRSAGAVASRAMTVPKRASASA